jgi:hypothetical protein
MMFLNVLVAAGALINELVAAGAPVNGHAVRFWGE